MPEALQPDVRAALPFASIAGRALELVKVAHAGANSPRGFAGIPTGLPLLDKTLGGLQTGLHILGAEPGAGKTALALNIARHAATQHQIPVVYVSFDEVPERLALKVLAARTGMVMSEMAGGLVQPAKVEAAMLEHATELQCLSFMQGDAHLGVPDLLAQLRQRLELHNQTEGLIVIDYLQPWAAAHASGFKGDFRLAVGELALAVRKLANESRCPVLLISAQSRQGQGSTNMTSLRESSDLEYGADSIMLLTKADGMVGPGRHPLTLTLAKNRFGPAGVQISLVLDGRTQVISEAVGLR
jgi:replicative DNA helicase